MIVKRGNIILADLPFSDRSGSKIRPALGIAKGDILLSTKN
jgi:hypothetical protein